MSKRDDAIIHLREALDLLSADTSGKSPLAHFQELALPGCELKVGGPEFRGGYSYYLTLPRNHPKPEDGRWRRPEDGDRYWTDDHFDTREEALRAGLIRLLSLPRG